jgi:hypothetical protein
MSAFRFMNGSAGSPVVGGDTSHLGTATPGRMCVCMCICIYIYVSIYMYLYICIYIYVCMYVCMHLCICICKSGSCAWACSWSETCQHAALVRSCVTPPGSIAPAQPHAHSGGAAGHRKVPVKHDAIQQGKRRMSAWLASWEPQSDSRRPGSRESSRPRSSSL